MFYLQEWLLPSEGMTLNQQSLLVNIDVEPTSTVADVKRYIGHVQPGNLSPEINLQFNGKLLQDEHTLRDYGVGPLSTLIRDIPCVRYSNRKGISKK